MRTQRKFLIFTAVIFICIFILVSAVISYAAQTTQAKNIAELFTEKNPALSRKTADNYASIILEASAKYKQDPYVIAAIIVHESTVKNNAVSKGGDYGLMQIRWKVHAPDIKKEYPKVKKATGLFDARVNIFYGTKIFAACMAKSNNDLRKGLLRYSAGSEKLANKVTSTVNALKAKEKDKTASASAAAKKRRKGKVK